MQRASSPSLYLVHQYKSSQLDEAECVPLTLCGPRGGAIGSLDTYPCVLLRNTVVVREPSMWWVIFVSRNGRVLSVSSSTANWMDASMVFRCAWKPVTWSRGRAVTVSSTYLFQKGTGDWYVDSALSSTLSMTRLATVTDTGEPMAVPNVCLKNSPLYAS